MKRGRGHPPPLASAEAGEQLLAKIEAANSESRDTVRLLHEARRDLNTDFAAMKQWFASDETAQAFRDARRDLQQWVIDELTRMIRADAAEALARLNTEIEQLFPKYAKELEESFHRVAKRMIERHPGFRPQKHMETTEVEIPPDLAQQLLKTLLVLADAEAGETKRDNK